MRRKDREIKDKSVIETIIQKADVCRVALCNDGLPYIVPMNFGYKEGCLFLHSAREGKKIDMLKNNNKVCFEIDCGFELVKAEQGCDWGMNYQSVIGFGKAFLVEGFDQKKKGLDVIMEKYSGGRSFEYSERAVNNVIIIKVEIDSMTGKSCEH